MIRRLRRLDRKAIDRALAALIFLVAEFELAFQTDIDGAYPPMAIVLGASIATLLWRRTRPLVAGAAMLGGWILMNVALADVDNLQTPLVAVLVMSYSMGPTRPAGRCPPRPWSCSPAWSASSRRGTSRCSRTTSSRPGSRSSRGSPAAA